MYLKHYMSDKRWVSLKCQVCSQTTLTLMTVRIPSLVSGSVSILKLPPLLPSMLYTALHAWLCALSLSITCSRRGDTPSSPSFTLPGPCWWLVRAHFTVLRWFIELIWIIYYSFLWNWNGILEINLLKFVLSFFLNFKTTGSRRPCLPFDRWFLGGGCCRPAREQWQWWNWTAWLLPRCLWPPPEVCTFQPPSHIQLIDYCIRSVSLSMGQSFDFS